MDWVIVVHKKIRLYVVHLVSIKEVSSIKAEGFSIFLHTKTQLRGLLKNKQVLESKD